MSVLSDSIELFIKELLAQSGEVSIQRNELAQHFACAPSQINYVLSTRFTLDRGYIIVSRRGGGGYIRVTRVEMGEENLPHELALRIPDTLMKHEARAIAQRLYESGYLTEREYRLMAAATDACAMPAQALEDAVRARVMRGMLTSLLERGGRGDSDVM